MREVDKYEAPVAGPRIFVSKTIWNGMRSILSDLYKIYILWVAALFIVLDQY